MHVERGVGDLDLAGEQQHRSHHQQDRSKKQDAGHQPFIEIGRDHRAKRQHKGNGGAGLDDADQAQSVAKRADLQQEPLGILRRDIVADHLVMKMADEIRQHRVAVAEIDHHQRDSRKQHADDQYVLLHLPVLCFDGSGDSPAET